PEVRQSRRGQRAPLCGLVARPHRAHDVSAALGVAASLGGPPATSRWLATTFYPCPADFPPQHLQVFALKRSSKPGAGSPLLTGGFNSPLQRRSPRPSPRCDVAVVSRVSWPWTVS